MAASQLAKTAFYELRKYKVKPSSFSTFLSLTNDHISLRMKHSKLLGYWTSELGGLNEVVHIWEYDSFEQRKAVRKALANDREWNDKYFSKILSLLDSQDNLVMVGVGPKPATFDKSENAVYDLRTYTLKYPSVTYSWNKPSREIIHAQKKHGQFVAEFVSAIGPMQTGFHLWRHENGDQRIALSTQTEHHIPRAELAANHVIQSVHTQLLVPTPFSPLH
eukprot:m.28267 g.28267  ORF g.28267 m.28267 type:complete len:220 (-) comp9072_c1_seq1:54-713(-)